MPPMDSESARRKERTDALRRQLEASDKIIKDYTVDDIEKSFESLHNHITSQSGYITKLIDELCDLCSGDKPILVMLGGYRRDVSKVLSTREKRGTGILTDIVTLDVTKDNLTFISEVSVRIQGVIPLTLKLEEIRQSLEQVLDALEKEAGSAT